MAGEKLVHILQDASKPDLTTTTDLVFGEVISISPLNIRVDNRFNIDSKFIILSELVKEKIITIDSHNHSVNGVNTSKELTEITLWRGLRVGDKVRILRLNQGQLYYVLERH